MKVTLASLVMAGLLGAPVVATADSAPQSLAITFHGDGARATQLPQYDPAEPIAISVKESSGQSIDSVTVVADGPGGETVRTPLARAAGGGFIGTLDLADAGAWSVHLTSHSRNVSIDTSSVTLVMQAPPPSNAWQIGVGVGTAIFIAIGGSGFLILRRALARDRAGSAAPGAAATA